MKPDPQCRKLTPDWKNKLLNFLKALEENGDAKFFHPHPFTEAYIDKLIMYEGKDLYYIVTEGETILCYGLLRGWDEGYEVPSLGICVAEPYKGSGLAQIFIKFIHEAARNRGAAKVRLRVAADNNRAMRFYKKIGYVFEGEEEGYLVGVFDLKPHNYTVANSLYGGTGIK